MDLEAAVRKHSEMLYRICIVILGSEQDTWNDLNFPNAGHLSVIVTDCVYCQACGSKTRNKIRKHTELKNFPLFLPQVQTGKFNKCSKFTSYTMHRQNWLMEVC